MFYSWEISLRLIKLSVKYTTIYVWHTKLLSWLFYNSCFTRNCILSEQFKQLNAENPIITSGKLIFSAIYSTSEPEWIDSFPCHIVKVKKKWRTKTDFYHSHKVTYFLALLFPCCAVIMTNDFPSVLSFHRLSLGL